MMFFTAAAAAAAVFAASDASRQCNATSTFCPEDGICCTEQYSPTKFGCRLPNVPAFSQPHRIRSGDYYAGAARQWPPSPTQSCCMPGPELEPSTTLPNCLILGDSVSIGYAGVAAKALADVCMTQHSPFDHSDGGAGSTAVGVACLDNFLATQRQTRVQWDVIMYNFGLHNTVYNSTAGEALYEKELTNITTRLLATGAKLIFATTTPYMPDTTVGNPVVAELNAIARNVIKGKGIVLLDLHKVVMDTCSPAPAHTAPYVDCKICRRHPCSYHYNSIGETAQGESVAAAMRPLVAEALASRELK